MSLDRHRAHLQDPPIEYRPDVRWWLAEGLHTDETLRHEIDSAHRLGFGGMEFLAMDEDGLDHARYGWGAEEWVHDTDVVVAETTARGMAVSFTSGTNWSNANLPTIDADHPAAAQELNVVTEDVSRARPRTGPLPRIDLIAERTESQLPGTRVAPTLQHLTAVVAAPLAEATALGGVLDASAIVDLTADVIDGSLEWTPPDDRAWRVFTFWRHGTGQTASPSATVNYTVNYLDGAGVDALTEYWDTVVLTPSLRQRIATSDRVQMYMDSLELSTWGEGGMLWGAHVAEEFERRRGYAIAPWLPFLTREVELMAAATTYRYEAASPDDAATVAKVRHDYVETLTDLYIEHMLRPFAAFLHANGITLRSEISYGLPFELTRPGPEVDGIETESLEFGSQIDAYRLLAGPAHLFDKTYSSETGATTRNHMLDHRFYDQIIATQFAAGVTRTVLHGWASVCGAEGATEWPGHEGMWTMFSERFDLRQPASEFYPLWTAAVARYQYLLSQGRPRVDVGILRTDHFVDNLVGFALIEEDGTRIPDEVAYGRMWMRDRQNLWWQDLGMQDAGWTYDYFDPSLLLREDVEFGEGVVQPEGPGYQALIVYQEALSANVARRLLEWAGRGLRVLLVNGAHEVRLLLADAHTVHESAASRTPGLDGRDAELAALMTRLRAQPSVAEIDDPALTVAALRGLGVVGRVEFVGDNTSVLTALREDGDSLHVFVYHFLYETGAPTTAEIALPGTGAVARIDAATGASRPHRGVRADGDRTVVTLELAPGETALLTLDRDAPMAESDPETTTEIAALEAWDIAVESWDAGTNETVTEDRGLGYVTTEVRPTTAVTRLRATGTGLAPWRLLDGVGPDVSGVGEYRTSAVIDAESIAGGRVELDLGSTCGALGSVAVNGSDPRGFDTSHPVVDVTALVRPGDNELVVRVSSSLNNRLKARGYYDAIPDIVLQVMAGREAVHDVQVRDYGLLGPVRFVVRR